MTEVREMTIASAHEGFKSGRFTARELVAEFLQRIAQIDKGGPRVNSTMAISDTVLTEAALLDDFYTKNRKFWGPLHGIPVLVKDQVSVTAQEQQGLSS
jgi:Asp-tRNA(Asn)/Glu-tRNA(Gln) amidotransferase A subunit family amidase